jgi:CRP-like cAMP-binding protein
VTLKAKALCVDPHWQGRSNCRRCSVRAAMPFAALEAADLDALLQPIDHFVVPAGTRLVDAGAPPAAVFTIRAGFVKLHGVTPEGRSRIFRLLRPGDVVGLEALAGHPHAHAAEAITAVDACRIPTAVLRDVEARRPALHEALVARWDAALRQADAFIVDLLAGPAPVRVARLLDMLVALADGGPAPRLTRQEIAAACDLTPETASRIASEWIAQGWLVETGDTFRIDREALRSVLAG